MWGKKKRKDGYTNFSKMRKRPKQNQNENLCPEYFIIEDVEKYTINGEIVIVKYKIVTKLKLETGILIPHSYSGKQNRQLGIN